MYIYMSIYIYIYIYIYYHLIIYIYIYIHMHRRDAFVVPVNEQDQVNRHFVVSSLSHASASGQRTGAGPGGTCVNVGCVPSLGLKALGLPAELAVSGMRLKGRVASFSVRVPMCRVARKKLMFMAAAHREMMVGEISTAKAALTPVCGTSPTVPGSCTHAPRSCQGYGFTVPDAAGKLQWEALQQRRDAYVKKWLGAIWSRVGRTLCRGSPT